MSNTLTPLVPVSLIADESIAYLSNRAGMAGRVYVETIQQNELNGGSSVVITKPSAIFTPQARDYTTPPAAQAITLPSVTLDINQQYEVKISLNELESRIARGGMSRVLRETVPAMMDGLITKIDQSLFALQTDYTQSVGTYNAALDDDIFRAGIQNLMDSKVNVEAGDTHLVLAPKAYITDLFAEDRYTLALNVGDNGQALRTGIAPKLYGVNVHYSQNVDTDSISGVTTANNLLFDKYAFVAGFIEFSPAKAQGASAPVEETFVKDPATGIPLRFSKFYDPNYSTWYLRIDVMWGVKTLDTSRFVRVISKVA